jgi:CBS domain-containing protein
MRDSTIESVNVYRGPRDRVRALAEAFSEAPAISVLARLADDARELAFDLLDEGMAAIHLTHIVAELNDLMTRRLIDLVSVKHDIGNLRYAWMALGSEGRLEQTLYTDQDNAIIFSTEGDGAAERARLLPFAKAVNLALAECGFRLCPGDVMAGNPAWCLSEAEWRKRFATWVDTGDPKALLHGAIFFDFRTLHGAQSLVDGLRSWLSARVAERPVFLRQMSENALRNQPPLWPLIGRIRVRMRGPRAGSFDVKGNGVSAFSDAARILALSRGLAATSTMARLRGWARTDYEARQAESWVRAFGALQTYRLQRQLACYRAGQPMDNDVRPRELPHFDAAVLRAALREARAAQKHLAIEYQLIG